MALEKDFELLDDYLANRLSAADKASFEKQIDADPELKQEFNTQQKLVEGIKQARLAELKSMLNNVPISAVPTGQTLLIKLGVVAIVAGLIGTGAYYFLLKDATEVTTPVEMAKDVPVQDESQPVEQPKEEPADTKETTAPVAEEKAAPKKSHKDATSSSVKKKTAPKEEISQTPPKPEAYDPSKDESSDSAANYQSLLLGSAIRSMNSSGLVVNNIPDSKKYDFHYQFIDGKLTLYGQKFRDSSMYEILEFFGNNKVPTTVVLYQSKKYYLLKENNEEITKLTAITDPALLNKLDDYKKRK